MVDGLPGRNRQDRSGPLAGPVANSHPETGRRGDLVPSLPRAARVAGRAPVRGTSIGAQLRAGREFSGISLDVLSRRTRLSRGVLEALEREAWDELPGEFYARGFLRQVAQELGLDGDAVVETFDAERMRQAEQPAVPTPATPTWMAESAPQSRGLSPAQLFLLIVTVATVVVFMISAQRKRAGSDVAGRPTPTATTTATARAAVGTEAARDRAGRERSGTSDAGGIPQTR